MADDVLADMQNILGYQGLVGQNPYLTYQGAIPFGNNFQSVNPFSGQVGAPTDAYGNPIQPPAGTTINSNPVQQQAPQQQAAPQISPDQAALNLMLTQAAVNALPVGMPDGGGRGAYTGTQDQLGILNSLQQQRAALAPSTRAQYPAILQALASGNFGALPGLTRAANTIGGGAAGAGGAGQPAGGTSLSGGGPLTNAQYLSLLANPGPLQQPGAAPPGPGQSPTGTPGPNVMSAFLAANKSGNTPFLNTLRTMQNQAAGGVG